MTTPDKDREVKETLQNASLLLYRDAGLGTRIFSAMRKMDILVDWPDLSGVSLGRLKMFNGFGEQSENVLDLALLLASGEPSTRHAWKVFVVMEISKGNEWPAFVTATRQKAFEVLLENGYSLKRDGKHVYWSHPSGKAAFVREVKAYG